MKVIIIADIDPRKEVIGGIATYSYNLTRYLTERGHEVLFYGKEQKGDIVNNFVNFKFINVSGMETNNMVFFAGLFKKTAFLNLSGEVIINAQRPDWMVPFLKFKNRKVITLPADHSQSIFLKKGRVVGSIYKVLEKKAIMGANRIISVSDTISDKVKAMYGLDRNAGDKFITIPTGIDISRFRNLSRALSRRELGISKEAKVVIYVGRLEKEKNLSLLIKSCGMAKLKLVVAGSGRQEIALRNLSQSIGADTLFLGAVSAKMVPKVMACGDVFAMSSYFEGFPNAVLEAMAAGLPVVATDAGDIKRVVRDGKTGYIARHDIEDFSNKLKKAFHSKGRLSRNCRSIVKKYSWNNIGKRIVEEYLR